jgi:transcriptional regulator GlxA family with amidase domain
VKVRTDVRVVDNGKILTAAGVSAGIDGALHVVSKMRGQKIAQKTAEYMEYRWQPESTASTGSGGR